jgi:regulator of nucleoside diphosphate kinase
MRQQLPAFVSLSRYRNMPSNRPIIVSDTDVSMLRALRANGALAAELDNAEIVPAGGVPPNIVTMNSRVRFEDTATGASREVTIVFPQDADASLGKVSILAPVGTALLGLAEGDSISWPFPDGQSRRLRVLEITFQPEAHEMLDREAR